MLVEVTLEDIRLGQKQNCQHCPVARALWRAMPIEGKFIFVGVWNVQLRDKEYPLPEVVSRFIRDFDSGKNVEPFSFELEL